MNPTIFVIGKLRGMNELEGKALVKRSLLMDKVEASTTAGTPYQLIVKRIYSVANLLQIPSTQDKVVR